MTAAVVFLPKTQGGSAVRNRDHYRGTFQVRSKALREAADADPSTVCWRCGLPARAGDPWQAGHVRDGDPTSPLMPEHRSCNTRAGARKVLDGFPTSRSW